jgi:hypothetical protein
MTKLSVRNGACVSALLASSFAGGATAAEVAAAAPSATPHSYLVFFDFNKSDLTAKAVDIVDKAAKDALDGKSTQIDVTGYTDTVGSDAYNLRLSKRRAMAVQAELLKQGLAAGEIAVFGKGKHDLLVPTADGVKEPQNRRVSIVFDTPPAAAPEQKAAEAAAAPAAPSCGAMTTPAMSASLAANCNPMSFDLGSILGKTYVTGVVSGLAQWQTNHAPGDKRTQADLSNGQVFIQKTDGVLQYYVQAGAYSIPDLGAAYVPTSKALDKLWGPLPVAFVKVVPTDTLSFQIGKLPTLIGAEYSFSFENLNIERGLLWNQEPAISKGVQANYTTGPLAVSVSWNDGIYSNRFNWVSALATYTIDPSNTLAVDFGTNVGHTGTNTYATPIAQNNETIANVMYTFTSGPWTINPYVQYTHVPEYEALHFGHEENSYAGALLVNYAFDSAGPLAGFSLPARFEYIGTTGSRVAASPNQPPVNLLYGPNSDAWSITVTPTYQYNVFFGRAEFSYVEATSKPTPGDAFGSDGNSTTQARVLLEAGIIF